MKKSTTTKQTVNKPKPAKQAKQAKPPKPVGQELQDKSKERPEQKQDAQQLQRTVSPTVKILQKIYGETAPEDVWPSLVDEGGYVVLGCEVDYNRGRHEFIDRMPPEHTWCRWGWDMGAPVRFESEIDASMFVKSLSLPDERGRILSRAYSPVLFYTGADEKYATSDDALPRKNYYEDEE